MTEFSLDYRMQRAVSHSLWSCVCMALAGFFLAGAMLYAGPLLGHDWPRAVLVVVCSVGMGWWGLAQRRLALRYAQAYHDGGNLERAE